MTTLGGPHTVGYWFVDTVSKEQNFFGHLFHSPDGQGYTFEYRFHYLTTGHKNWYRWSMATADADEVARRINFLFTTLGALGLVVDGPVCSVVRKPDQSEEDFARDVLAQPWCHVIQSSAGRSDRSQ